MCFLNNNPYISPLILRFSAYFVDFSQNFSISLTDQLPQRAEMASANVGEQRPGSLRSVSGLAPISLCCRDLIPLPECPPPPTTLREMGLQHHNHLKDSQIWENQKP